MLRYRGADEPTLLFDWRPHRTLHMSSFTKLIAPGVRLRIHARRCRASREDRQGRRGHLHLARLLRARRHATNGCAAACCGPQIEKLKALYAPRLDACLAALDQHIPDAVATRPDGGFFLSLTLPAGISTTDLRAAAAKRNLNLADGLAFFPQGGGERFLRLPFCALTPGTDRRRHRAPR